MDTLEFFDLLMPIEPSVNWEGKLQQRIQRSEHRPIEYSGSRMLVLTILILLAFNLFSFSKNWLNERSLQSNKNMRNIAAEYLISTNSSKF